MVDVFKAYFVDCHFFVNTFHKLFVGKLHVDRSIEPALQWKNTFKFWNNPRTR